MADKAEERRKVWTKENVDKRKEQLIKHGCDKVWVGSLSNEELVQNILITEGLAAGKLTMAQPSTPASHSTPKTVPTVQSISTVPTDTTQLMLMMIQQMREDSERRAAEAATQLRQQREEANVGLLKQRRKLNSNGKKQNDEQPKRQHN